MKTTVVIGASENTERYSNRVVKMLHRQNMPVIAIGLKEGEIDGVKIQTALDIPKIGNLPAGQAGVDTVTLYVGAKNQPQYYDYILSLKPARVIFNPGTENSAFEKLLEEKGIEVLQACTLTMLSVGNY